MEKPKPETRVAYNYLECIRYVEEKYGYKSFDFANCSSRWYIDEVPYQNFWHHICDTREINNGCYFSIDMEELDWTKEEWVKTIMRHLMEEFGDPGVNHEVDFWVSW